MGQPKKNNSNSGIIKTIAKAIDDHGNSNLYESGFDAWWSDQPNIAKSIIEEKATEKWLNDVLEGDRERYRRLVEMKGLSWQNRFKQRQKLKQDALKYWYQTEILPGNKSWETKAKLTPNQLAAAVSIPGAAISLIPTPVTRTAGTVLSAPDIIYDWAALGNSNESNVNSNTAHVITDYIDKVAKITPIKWDDALGASIGIIGNVDDYKSASGDNWFQVLDQKRQTEKSPDKQNVRESTAVRKHKKGAKIKLIKKSIINKNNPDQN